MSSISSANTVRSNDMFGRELIWQERRDTLITVHRGLAACLKGCLEGQTNAPESAWAGADEGTQHQKAADEGQSSPERELVSACASWA